MRRPFSLQVLRSRCGLSALLVGGVIGVMTFLPGHVGAVTCGGELEDIYEDVGSCVLLDAINAIPDNHFLKKGAYDLVVNSPQESPWIWPTAQQEKWYSWLYMTKIETANYRATRVTKGRPLAVRMQNGKLREIFGALSTGMIQFVKDDKDKWVQKEAIDVTHVMPVPYFKIRPNVLTPQTNFVLPVLLEQGCTTMNDSMKASYTQLGLSFKGTCLHFYGPYEVDGDPVADNDVDDALIAAIMEDLSFY